MSQKQTPAPQWVKASREFIDRIRSKLVAIRRAGQDEIRMGLEKVVAANNIEREVDYVSRFVFKEYSEEVWNDEIIMTTGTQLVGMLANLDSQTGLLANYATASAESLDDNHGLFALTLPSSDSSGGTAVYNVAAMESRIHAIQPEYTPLYGVSPPERLTSRERRYEELEVLLGDYNEKFVNMLEGSESALNSESPDHLSQAAHSMRDLFQQLLEHLAPSSVVKTQPWFEPTEGAPGGVSRRSRLRYLLYGSGESIDEGVIEQLDNTAHSAKQALDLCIARAHDHDPSLTGDEVQLSIDQARFSLTKVLELHKAFREDQSDQ